MRRALLSITITLGLVLGASPVLAQGAAGQLIVKGVAERGVKPLSEAIARLGTRNTDDLVKAISRNRELLENPDVKALIREFGSSKGMIDDVTRLALTRENSEIWTVLAELGKDGKVAAITTEVEQAAIKAAGGCVNGACPPGLKNLGEVFDAAQPRAVRTLSAAEKEQVRSQVESVLGVRDDLELALQSGGASAEASQEGIDLILKKLDRVVADAGSESVFSELSAVRERLVALKSADGEVSQGVRAALDELDDVLRSVGVKVSEVRVGDVFDPNVHNAVFMQPAEGAAKNQISMILKRGAEFDGKMIRVSDVAVSP